MTSSLVRGNRDWRLAGAVVVAYAALACAYSLVNPLFESPDEFYHYEYVRYIVDRSALPVLEAGRPSEYHQPPLYYALGALLIGGVPVEPFAPAENPFWGYDAFRFGIDNKTRYLHTDRESFPYQGTTLAAHILRLYSVALGVLTVLVSYDVLRSVFDRPALALGALALVAFNPQFLFVSASISNDNLIALFSVLLIGLSIRVARFGLSLPRVMGLALLLAAAVLTKLSGAVLAVLPVLAVFLAKAPWLRRFSALALAGGVIALATGWWFLRNYALYGDLTGISMWQGIWGWQNVPLSASNVEPALRAVWNSYWGQFGLGQVVLPEWLYGLLALIGLASLVGLLRLVTRRRVWPGVDRLGLGFLAVSVSILFASTLWYALVNPTGGAGRFLFPGIPAVAGLIFLGLRGLFRLDRVELDRHFAGLAYAAMITLSLGSLIGVIAPAYARPASVNVDEARRQTQAADIRFDDAAILLGYAIDRNRVFPGDEMHVRLCWQTLKPVESGVYFLLHLLGPDNSIVGRRASFHGLGRYPSPNWQAGDVFCDEVPLVVEDWAPAPAVYNLEVGLTDRASHARLEAIGPDGVRLAPVFLAPIKVRTRQFAAGPVPNPISVDVGEQISLVGSDLTAAPVVRPGEPITLTLYWRAERMPDEAYTVFVHVRDSGGQALAQADSPPQAGSYPTSFWDEGEVIGDPHRIEVPASAAPGDYRIYVGMYRPATGERLPVAGNPNGEIELGRLSIAQ